MKYQINYDVGTNEETSEIDNVDSVEANYYKNIMSCIFKDSDGKVLAIFSSVKVVKKLSDD